MSPPPNILIDMFTQAALYGLYIATLIHCLRWLVYTDDGWKQRDRINKPMLIITILIFLFSTVNLALMLPIQSYFLGFGQDSSILRVAGVEDLTGTAPILIVDAVLIYRCWTVFGHSWRVVWLPIIFWLSSLTCTILIIYYDYLSAAMAARFLQLGNDAEVGFYSSNIATNLFSTCAIIYRILSVANASGGRPKPLHNTARILAESGILYTSTSVFSLIGYILEANARNWGSIAASHVLDAINYSMAGITFNIILIRVHQDRLRLTDSYADASTLSGFRFHTTHSTTNSTTPESQATHPANAEHCAEQDGHRD